MNKLMKQIVVGAVVVGLGLAVYAQTLLTTVASDVRDLSIQQNQSKMPHQDDRGGYVFAIWNAAVDGGSGTIEVGPEIPEGIAVSRAVIQVITPVTPAAAATNLQISLQQAGDLLARGRSLAAAGVAGLGPSHAETVTATVTGQSDTNGFVTNVVSTTVGVLGGTPFVVTNDLSTASFNFGTAATQGVAAIYLELIKMQP